MNRLSKAQMVHNELPYIKDMLSKGVSQNEVRRLLAVKLGTHISVGTYYVQLRKEGLTSGTPRVSKASKVDGVVEIELSTDKIKKLAKGKMVTEGVYTIKPKAVSYKELYEATRSQLYNVRYQYKKLLKHK